MAVVYAIKNGNWSDGSTWNTGSVPTAEDDVYANGYTVNLDLSVIDIGNGTLMDYYNENTDRFGGNFVFVNIGANDYTVIANIKAKYNHTLKVLGDKTTYVIGNLVGDSENACAIATLGNASNLNILGNIHEYSLNRSPYVQLLTVNGNIYCVDKPFAINKSATYSLQINLTGELHIGAEPVIGNNNLSTYNINGKLCLYHNYVLSTSKILSGIIDLSNYEGNIFPLVGNNNTNVANNTQLIIPKSDPVPQSVVLKGYEYGGKVGTLEVVNIPDTTLNRLANCATMQEVAQLSITIANKDNE